MVSGARTRRVLSLAILAAAVSVGGCRTSSNDIDRWTNTKQGPRKLVAVLIHDKYPVDLRVDSALALIRMKPRSGKRIGILGDEGDKEAKGLINSLAALPPAERNKLVSKMVPRLVEEIKKAPAPAQAGQPAPVDSSTPFKDAAFALLTHEPNSLVAADADRKVLEQALGDWAVTNFADRVDDPSQLYGVEQILRYLKADGVRRLPALLDAEGKKNDLIAKLISDLGSPETKLEASQKLVAIATDVASAEWKAKKAPGVQAANEASKLKPTKEQFDAQLDQYQQEELVRVFSSMKKVGGAPVVKFLLDYAKDDKNADDRRAAALAALEGNLGNCSSTDCDADTKKNVEVVMGIAQSDKTPDPVRDQALRRLGEMPRKLVVDRLYGLFKNDNWKVRWMSADLILKMSQASDLGEFMDRLGRNAAGMAITEPLAYGRSIADLKGTPEPAKQIDAYLGSNHPVAVRLAAFGYYYNVGAKADLAKVEPHANDGTKVPECKEGAAGCEWKCVVSDGKTEELKEVTTVGEFVRYCVKPAIEKR
jgi:hypothetical protein